MDPVDQQSGVGEEAGGAVAGGKGSARFGKIALIIAFYPALSLLRALPGPFD